MRLLPAGFLLIVSTLVAGCQSAASTRTYGAPEAPRGVFGDETMPHINGGLEAVARHLRYPADALRARVEGQVIVKLLIDEKGEIAKAEVTEGIGYGCDEEALRAAAKATYLPALKGDQPIAAWIRFPITFRLSH